MAVEEGGGKLGLGLGLGLGFGDGDGDGEDDESCGFSLAIEIKYFEKMDLFL